MTAPTCGEREPEMARAAEGQRTSFCDHLPASQCVALWCRWCRVLIADGRVLELGSPRRPYTRPSVRRSTAEEVQRAEARRKRSK